MMMSKAVQNERAKLLASFMNTIAATFLSAGCIGPALALFYGLTPVGTGTGVIVTGSAVCILMSAGIHFIGRLALGGIRE
ncbi:MAG: hypothetical protein ABWY18_16660 [Tardiphaga sp.]